MKKMFPSKELVAQLGSYQQEKIVEWSESSGYFSGIDNIFETSRYILVEPLSTVNDGYFWIDKENNCGIRIASTNIFQTALKNIIEGRIICFVKGSNEHEIISCLQPLALKIALRIMENEPEISPFNDSLISFFENADPDGNPIVIIYEH